MFIFWLKSKCNKWNRNEIIFLRLLSKLWWTVGLYVRVGDLKGFQFQELFVQSDNRGVWGHISLVPKGIKDLGHKKHICHGNLISHTVFSRRLGEYPLQAAKSSRYPVTSPVHIFLFSNGFQDQSILQGLDGRTNKKNYLPDFGSLDRILGQNRILGPSFV